MYSKGWFSVAIKHVVLRSYVLAFLYVTANSKKICEEVSFPCSSADVSIFVEIQAKYLQKIRGYPHFFGAFQ